MPSWRCSTSNHWSRLTIFMVVPFPCVRCFQTTPLPTGIDVLLLVRRIEPLQLPQPGLPQQLTLPFDTLELFAGVATESRRHLAYVSQHGGGQLDLAGFVQVV